MQNVQIVLFGFRVVSENRFHDTCHTGMATSAVAKVWWSDWGHCNWTTDNLKPFVLGGRVEHINTMIHTKTYKTRGMLRSRGMAGIELDHYDPIQSPLLVSLFFIIDWNMLHFYAGKLYVLQNFAVFMSVVWYLRNFRICVNSQKDVCEVALYWRDKFEAELFPETQNKMYQQKMTRRALSRAHTSAKAQQLPLITVTQMRVKRTECCGVWP